MKKTLSTLAVASTLALLPLSAQAAGDAPVPPTQNWPHHGITGTYDKASLQRGFQVYKEVCAACHSLKYVAYRNLEMLGYTPEQIKAVAGEYTVMDGPNDDGDMFERPARPSDRFVPPFANDQAARAANGGAFPPDLSLVVKARKHGEDYLHALLTGYTDAPAGNDLPAGMYWNRYFSGHQIAMAPPLMPDHVSYADGTPATVDQMARDVTQFLAWAAEPYQDQRKQMGLKVLIYLGVFASILYAVKRKVWAGLK